jgi:hypothetical protein
VGGGETGAGRAQRTGTWACLPPNGSNARGRRLPPPPPHTHTHKPPPSRSPLRSRSSSSTFTVTYGTCMAFRIWTTVLLKPQEGNCLVPCSGRRRAATRVAPSAARCTAPARGTAAARARMRCIPFQPTLMNATTLFSLMNSSMALLQPVVGVVGQFCRAGCAERALADYWGHVLPGSQPAPHLSSGDRPAPGEASVPGTAWQGRRGKQGVQSGSTHR